MELKGIIDLGSNSIRLVVYEMKEPGKRDRKHENAKGLAKERPRDSRFFRSIMDEKKIAGLSAYVKKGIFSQEGIECAVETLQRHIRAAENIGCKDISIFATAVIRNCENSADAAKEIRKGVGIDIDVLSAVDEAHLGFVGATCSGKIESGTLIDIGGGSTELTSIQDGVDCLDLSIPQGSVSSYAEFVEMILPRQEEIERIKAAFSDKLDAVADLGQYDAMHLFGIGGSVRAIRTLYGAAFANDSKPEMLMRYQIDSLAALLRDNPSTFAHAASRAVPDRMHTVVPGIAITQVLMERLGADTLTICKYGIREGYLLERVLGV